MNRPLWHHIIFLIVSAVLVSISIVRVPDTKIERNVVVEVTTEIETTTEAIEEETVVEDIAIEETELECAVVHTEPETTQSITVTTDDYNLYLLAHLIWGEAGSDWCSDEMQLYVGSVALNRVNHSAFPNTLEGVIYQPGQYTCMWAFRQEPNARAWANAQYLLDNGSQLPANVVFQSSVVQGNGVYCQVGNMYFCYL